MVRVTPAAANERSTAMRAPHPAGRSTRISSRSVWSSTSAFAASGCPGGTASISSAFAADQIDPILTAANLELTNQDIAEIEGSTR
jgi:hypothetical protein